MNDVDRDRAPRLLRTHELKARGLTDRRIRAAVASGELIRLREGSFATMQTPPPCVDAGMARGRLACISELKRRGVFVLAHTHAHVHVPSTTSRLGRATSSAQSGGGGRLVHRGRLHRTPHPGSLSVDVFDALIQAVRCQEPRAAVATIDSALNSGLLRDGELDELFQALPRKYRPLRRLVDGRAESGSETLMRLILRSLGCSIDLQVRIDGVGRVDFVVDGWLIIECDSEAHHSSWEQQKKDRRRDQAAAARGYVTHRAIAEDILWHPEKVREAVAGLLRHRCTRTSRSVRR